MATNPEPQTTTTTAASTTKATTSTTAPGNAVTGLQEPPVTGDAKQCPPVPANVDNYSGVNTDDFHASHGGAVCCFKGGIIALHTAAAEVCQFRQTRGDSFRDFAQTRLGLTPLMTDFLVHVAEIGIDPAQFSPAIEVKMAAVMGTMARIVATWAAATNSTAPTARENAFIAGQGDEQSTNR